MLAVINDHCFTVEFGVLGQRNLFPEALNLVALGFGLAVVWLAVCHTDVP